MKRKFYSILMFALLSLLLTACNPFEPFTNLIKLGQQALRPETEGITPPPTVTMIVPTPTSIDVTIVSTEPQATEHLASLESSPTAALLTPLSVETNAAIERPDVYQLQPGEYSFCLARRYDIHPADLNRYNGLNTRQQFQPGQQINLPPQARPFPWERALLLHPADYSVRPGDTIYSIACYYGDVDPIALATANRLTAPYLLEAGQVLQIPGASQYVAAQVQPVVPVATESAAEIPNPIATTKIILSSSTPPPLPSATFTAKVLPPTPTLIPPTQRPAANPPTLTPTIAAAVIQQRVAVQVAMPKVRFDLGSAKSAVPADVRKELKYLGMGGGGGPENMCPQSLDRFRFRLEGQGVYNDSQGEYETIELNSKLTFYTCGWAPGEKVKLNVQFPDGNIYQQGQPVEYDQQTALQGLAAAHIFQSYLSDPAGTYTFVFTGEQSQRRISGSIEFVQPAGGRAMFSYQEPAVPGYKAKRIGYTLYGFKPYEKVRAFAYLIPENSSDGSLIGWLEFQTDQNGNLFIEIDSNQSRIDYQFIGVETGESLILPWNLFGSKQKPVLK